MSKHAHFPDKLSYSNYLRSLRGQAFPFREVFEQLVQQFGLAEGMILSAMPRGGLNIVQPARFPEALVRKYGKGAEIHDRLSWGAITGGRAVTAAELWRAGGDDPFVSEFLKPAGFVHAAAFPLTAPLLDGYPGALHVYRRGSGPPFADIELAEMADVAKEVSAALERTRRARSGHASDPDRPTRPGLFILDDKLRSLLPSADPAQLDPQLYQNLLDHARTAIERVDGSVTEDRVPLPDSRGDLWNFRVVAHPSFPALGDSRVVFFCLQPVGSDWNLLRPGDFQADEELARLIPAVRFMQEHFQARPTLVEIARAVHLSPFHFHRRFTELLGITPKHLLLDCQIQQAKKDLSDFRKDLASIASGCGFAHQSHFTSRFKQATGLTPTRWRKLIREQDPDGR